MALRRQMETAVWNQQSALPGGLRHGAPGYVATRPLMPPDSVRDLMHALIRSFHGDRSADALHVPEPDGTAFRKNVGSAGATV
jgi:hypothetical protein